MRFPAVRESSFHNSLDDSYLSARFFSLLNSSMKTLGSSLFWRGFNLIKTEEESSCALLRHGYGCLCLGYPTPAQMRPNHLFLAKAGACVRFHLDLFKDYDFRSNLNNRKCDSLFHGLYFWK